MRTKKFFAGVLITIMIVAGSAGATFAEVQEEPVEPNIVEPAPQPEPKPHHDHHRGGWGYGGGWGHGGGFSHGGKGGGGCR